MASIIFAGKTLQLCFKAASIAESRKNYKMNLFFANKHVISVDLCKALYSIVLRIILELCVSSLY